MVDLKIELDKYEKEYFEYPSFFNRFYWQHIECARLTAWIIRLRENLKLSITDDLRDYKTSDKYLKQLKMYDI